MKKLSLLIILLWGTVPTQVFAQQINSHITSSYYLANPKGYLSKLDNAIIPSNILLDRALPTSPIDDYSGSGTVLTGTFTEWSNLFFEQMNGTAGGYNMDAWLALDKAYLHSVRDEEIVPILIQNMKYTKVNAQAISNGLLYEQDSFLVENTSYKSQIIAANEAQREQLIANLYTTHRTFASSTVYGRIHGNSITFELDSNFYFSNIKNETIETVEIDFGNGTGYQFVDWNTPITVTYTGTSAFIECAVKFIIIDNTNTPQTLYTHFTVLRTGDDVVPNLEAENATNGRASINPSYCITFGTDVPDGIYVMDVYQYGAIIYPPGWIKNYLSSNYLPGETVSENTIISGYNISGMLYLTQWELTPTNNLQVCFLFAPNNTSGKLRKPILILDGFDPGNKRNYYQAFGDDPRGLFEVMNGNLHKYYENPSTSNTASLLREIGYDLVFIDFLNGDDYMQLNGGRVVDLLTLLNGSTYRDEFTEEWVVVGPSMGGLISRYALKTMEDESTPHYVRQWISFDSPHEGAYVPLALQYTLHFLRGLDSKAQDGLNALRSPASRQLLIRHIDSDVGNWRGSFLELMGNLGYPEKLEKIAISNGALANLYESNETIINFRIFFSAIPIIVISGRRLEDNQGTYVLLSSFGAAVENATIYVSNTLPFENMPGGYLDHLTQMSDNPDNQSGGIIGAVDEIATHIPLLSAFGVPVTRNNYGGTNLYWAMQSGPFDKIHFQPTSYNINDIIPLEKVNNGNQVHMTITNETKDYISGQIEDNIDNIILPHFYSNEFLAEPYVENITGSVAYNAKSTIEFSSIYQNTSEFIIESSANVTSTAGESITLKTGFHAKNGSSFSARLINTNGGRVASSVVSTTTPINYASTSSYSNNKHSYASLLKNNDVLFNVENNTTSMFSIYPTVSDGFYNIANKEIGKYNVEVINSVGQIIVASTVNLEKIDLSSYPNGLYFVRIKNINQSYVFKVIKK